MLEEKRVFHNGLSGRATNVFSVTSQPQVLEKFYKIANKEPDVLNLALVNDVLPRVFGPIYSNHLGLEKEGTRVLHMITSEWLIQITRLTSKPFLQWWYTVKCNCLFVFGSNLH